MAARTWEQWIEIHKCRLSDGAASGESLQRFMKIAWDAAMGVIAQRIKDEEATKLRTIAQDQGIIEYLANIAELNADVEAKALASVDWLHDLFGVMREEFGGDYTGPESGDVREMLAQTESERRPF